MSSDKTHYVVYAGDGVVQIPGVGVFQQGTGAWVDAATAELVRRQGGFQVMDPQGRVEQPAAAPPAPAPAPPPEPPPAQAAAEPPKPEAPEAAPAPAEAATPPQKRPRRGRASAMISAVQVDEEKAATPADQPEPKK
ncbi:MAG TPA: hypothetical protein VKE22_02875 [Haliangiales bacterium]|nr:hypothetical protein [Haliangiales bacterium]